MAANDKPQRPNEVEVALPQGHRLIIRNLEPGAIVEVASWVGTAGPGEQAVRMLFGSASQDGFDVPPSIYRHSEVPSYLPTEEEYLMPRDSDEFADPIVSRYNLRRNQLDASRTKSRRVLRRAIATAASVAVAAIVLVILNVTGVAILQRPDGGITTGLGPASSSVAVVNKRVDIEKNSTVLVDLGDETKLAGVASVGENKLEVFDESGAYSVDRGDVVGRVLFVFPFLGYLGG